MLFRSSIASILFVGTVNLSFDSSLAVPCDLDPDVSGLGEEIFFDSTSKISISGFAASVSYVSLPLGKQYLTKKRVKIISYGILTKVSIFLRNIHVSGDPYIKILGASEPFLIAQQDEVLTIQAGTCDDPEDSVSVSRLTDLDTSDPEEIKVDSSAITMFGGFTASMMLAPRGGLASTLLISSLLLGGNLSPVSAQDDSVCTCMPTLDIEISLPVGTETSPRFGDTDHYVEANLENVVWGWYDPNATAILTAQSGETVTMEGITSVCGLDYAKTIRGDPNVEAAFGWRVNETIVTKSEPKLPGSGPHLVTGPVAIEGAMPGDVLQVDILEVDPRLNPETGKCYGINMQIRNGYHYRTTNYDGVPYDTGGPGLREAFTVMEFVQDEDDNMLYGKPV